MRRVLILIAFLAIPPAIAQTPSPHAIDIPPWFSETFLDLREDAREAAKTGRRLLVYFGQDGCPYCKELMLVNFTQPRIVDKTRKHFGAIALNLWGDREVTWIDGRAMSEKALARALKVQFTPTILFLDEKGKIVLRLNGYYPPHRFEAALDYAAGRMEQNTPFRDYLVKNVKDPASETLHDEPFFVAPPRDLRRKAGAKPLAVLFETRHCAGCDELHQEGFKRKQVLAQLAKFDVVRIDLQDSNPAWVGNLKITYVPSIVFFVAGGREVFRIEAYLRPFHLAGSLEYVSSGAYAREPSFQRFLQARAERLRGAGEPVDLWK